ncbi:MAG: chloramphenicol O-acetyltransferase [Myxococcota bacterium]|jgi:chloramphenicol O-acetyltransferase
MKVIDPETWPRRPHFEHFRTYQMPWFHLAARVQVGPLVRWARSEHVSVARTLVWAVAAAANRVPELRQRIRGEDVVEHEVVHPSFTILRKDGTFTGCPASFDPDLRAFLAASAEAVEARRVGAFVLAGPEDDRRLYLTSLPWLDLAMLVHPFRGDANDCVPRIAWGRLTRNGDATDVSVGLTAHHALVDGLHAARFYAALEAIAADVTAA